MCGLGLEAGGWQVALRNVPWSSAAWGGGALGPVHGA